MQRLLPAILLCAGLQSALAAAPDPAHPAPPAPPPGSIVQAQLDVAADGVPITTHTASVQGAKSVGKAGATAAAPHDDEQRPAGMLFAALALMTGIALRRWGMGQQ